MNAYSAEKLIQEVKKDHKKLDTKKIFNEQSVVINRNNTNHYLTKFILILFQTIQESSNT